MTHYSSEQVPSVSSFKPTKNTAIYIHLMEPYLIQQFRVRNFAYCFR